MLIQNGKAILEKMTIDKDNDYLFFFINNASKIDFDAIERWGKQQGIRHDHIICLTKNNMGKFITLNGNLLTKLKVVIDFLQSRVTQSKGKTIRIKKEDIYSLVDFTEDTREIDKILERLAKLDD